MKTMFRQADGSHLRLESDPGYEVMDPWDSGIRVTFPLDGRSPDVTKTRQLHVSHRGNNDYAMQTLLQATVYHRLSAQGGEFLVAASSVPENQGMALWRGPYHEIATFVPDSTHRDVARALRPLMGLTFIDSPEGLEVIPDSSLGATVSVIESSTYVRGVGLVDVRSAAEGLGAVPPWSGAKVKAGEIWKARIQEEGDDEVVDLLQLATDTALVVITPEKAQGRAAGMARAVGFAQAVTHASVTPGRDQDR